MPDLFSYLDFERQSNSTLSDPDGRSFANTVADSLLAWSARYCNRLGWECGTYTESFSPDEYLSTFYVSTLPLDTAEAVSVATFNDASDTYDSYLGIVRKNAASTITTADALGYGYESVRVSYTGGYTADTFPNDLKQALTEFLGQKVNDAINGGMTCVGREVHPPPEQRRASPDQLAKRQL